MKQMDEFPPQIYCGDLESTNGTFLNGVCIGRLGDEKIGHLLCDGDVVEIKPDSQFEFHQSIKRPSPKSPKELEDIEVRDAASLRTSTYEVLSNSRNDFK